MAGIVQGFLAKAQKDILLLIVLFLISTTGFALGYLLANEFNHSPIVISQCDLSSESEN